MNNRRLQLLSTIGAVALAALLFYLLATERSRLSRATAAWEAQKIEHGAALYSLHCRMCHGNRGEGVGQLGPPLSNEHFFKKRQTEVGWHSTLEKYIVATTAHGRMMGTRPIYAGNGSTAVMSPWAQLYGGPLRADQINLLTAFILNWKSTATGTVQLNELQLPKLNVQDPRLIEQGKQVFLKNCIGCHQFGALQETGASGPDLTDIASYAASRKTEMEAVKYVEESILIPGAFIVDGYRDVAVKQPCGAMLTKNELRSIGAYLLQ